MHVTCIHVGVCVWIGSASFLCLPPTLCVAVAFICRGQQNLVALLDPRMPWHPFKPVLCWDAKTEKYLGKPCCALYLTVACRACCFVTCAKKVLCRRTLNTVQCSPASGSHYAVVCSESGKVITLDARGFSCSPGDGKTTQSQAVCGHAHMCIIDPCSDGACGIALCLCLP